LIPGMGNYSLPNAILIKEGKCYYRSPMEFRSKEIHEFYDRSYANATMILGVMTRPNQFSIYWEYAKREAFKRPEWK